MILNACGETQGTKVVLYEPLVGNWERSDGTYTLNIRSVAQNGAVDVGYFNPKPIHVAKALASQADGRVAVAVELQDVNYPGSLYRLTYDQANDRLTGTYYQAVARETYGVLFVRRKP